MSTHHHEDWQIRPSGRGGLYCAACGDSRGGIVDWGVRDKSRASSVVAFHPSQESAEATVQAHPDWYELVWSVRPAERTWTAL